MPVWFRLVRVRGYRGGANAETILRIPERLIPAHLAAQDEEPHAMAGKPIELTPSAYGNPLLIRSLFRTAMDLASDQEIVHAGRERFTYREFGERVHRLASALADIGVVARADRRSDGLGHAPLSGMFFCHPDDGGGAAHGEHRVCRRSKSSTPSTMPKTTSSWSMPSSCRSWSTSGTASIPARSSYC